MRTSEESPFANIDWITVGIYVVLVIMGWLNIYAAVYDEQHQSIFDISQKYGKQMIWILTAFILAFIILVIEADFYTVFAYAFYIFFLVLNLAVPFLGKEIKGSKSWFRIGDVGIQPAEFMKFATNLALAKFLSNQNLSVISTKRYKTLSDYIEMYKNTIVTFIIIGVPMIIILVLQNETGLALTFTAFIITLYREGLSVNYIILGFMAVLLFILSLLIPQYYFYIAFGIFFALWFYFGKHSFKIFFTKLAYVAAASVFVFSSNYLYSKLQPHQRGRIDVLLGRGEINLKKEGYNVHQSKIAIGSGGLFGKGYLKGTQTKYNFVPEQDTDFIFCTVGEEWGFVGSTLVLVLFAFLIIRIILLAERQRSEFSRIYGYGVASILFFHLVINIGMTIGVLPVIGIPLPFFSYGGSSLWEFTILLFIFLKLDAHRLYILR
ncbi:MAG: rod shape-determining protein RodA [Bacteroidia bacterium]|nr:rod shape-determining protein RodA [Bacteroidia bacterium]